MENNINWIVHHVFGYDPSGNFANNHTHGMEQYGHLDFQLVLNISPLIAQEILNNLGVRVRDGDRFKPGDMVDNIITNYAVHLVLKVDSERPVLRVLLPDPNGLFPGDKGCQEPYSLQEDVDFVFIDEDDD